MKIEFIPKAGGEPWTADLSAELHGNNGFDIVLMLDKVANTEDSGWMLELAIERSGTVSGQITAHPGSDALALFECAQDQMTIQPNAVGPVFTIHEQQPAVDPLAEAIRALRLIYAGSSEEGRWPNDNDVWCGDLDSCAWHAKAALEKIGVPLVELGPKPTA